MVADKTLEQVAIDFKALRPEDRKAMSHIVRRLADRARQGPVTPQESASLLVEAAGETGNARVVEAAEKTVGKG